MLSALDSGWLYFTRRLAFQSGEKGSGLPLMSQLAAAPGGQLKRFTRASTLATLPLTVRLGACVASLYPAWKASRLRPVEALSSV